MHHALPTASGRATLIQPELKDHGPQAIVTENSVVASLRNAALIVLGVALLFFGIRKWQTQSGPQRVLLAFCHCLQSGDRDGALDLLDPLHRNLALKHLEADDAPWEPSPELRFTVERVDVNGREAIAQILFREGEFKLRPRVHLHQTPSGDWRIGQIVEGHIESVWAKAEQARRDAEAEARAQADRQLQDDLARALRDRPWVHVQRDLPEATLRR